MRATSSSTRETAHGIRDLDVTHSAIARASPGLGPRLGLARRGAAGDRGRAPAAARPSMFLDVGRPGVQRLPAGLGRGGAVDLARHAVAWSAETWQPEVGAEVARRGVRPARAGG